MVVRERAHKQNLTATFNEWLSRQRTAPEIDSSPACPGLPTGGSREATLPHFGPARFAIVRDAFRFPASVSHCDKLLATAATSLSGLRA